MGSFDNIPAPQRSVKEEEWRRIKNKSIIKSSSIYSNVMVYFEVLPRHLSSTQIRTTLQAIGSFLEIGTQGSNDAL